MPEGTEVNHAKHSEQLVFCPRYEPLTSQIQGKNIGAISLKINKCTLTYG
jgi:hypothetical protein